MKRHNERSRSEDELDERIVGVLRGNARASFVEIGRAVGLSANAVAARVRRLEDRGVIEGYAILLANRHPAVEAIVEVRLSTEVAHEDVERRLSELTCVLEILDLSGRADYMVRIGCRSIDEVYAAVQRIRAIDGIVASETRSVLRVVLRR
jgi:Lrp/AsnC family leucine-responsive transcriptional regulator